MKVLFGVCLAILCVAGTNSLAVGYVPQAPVNSIKTNAAVLFDQQMKNYSCTLVPVEGTTWFTTGLAIATSARDLTTAAKLAIMPFMDAKLQPAAGSTSDGPIQIRYQNQVYSISTVRCTQIVQQASI
jgi:hypothetical protein